jgi:glutamyl-tRNA synthetase/nondiscriminating glutamyl-tRNA synthetase
VSGAGALRLRFAPSPTGDLHVGNARTALFNWLLARSKNGTLILRIEDTDQVRSTRASEEGILADLRWLGLGWDEGIDEGGEFGPYRQSERLDRYRDEAARLVASGTAYPCFCDPALLEKERAAQREAGHVSLYSGRCRSIPPAEAAARRGAGEVSAVRFNVRAAARGEEAVVFEDEVRGPIRFPVPQIGDFVLLRQDGLPAYNFAVVVDDLAMRISDVIRGDDHLSNTPRQVLVYRALGGEPPRFAHLPLITAPGGAPLSKRDGAVSVQAFRDDGYPPEALLNHLALLGWSPASGVDFLTLEELVAGFDLSRVSHSPAVFDRQKLDALSARHIARMPPGKVEPPAVEHLTRAGLLPERAPAEVRAWAGRLAMLYADRLPRFGLLPRETSPVFLFDVTRCFDDDDVASTLADERARHVIERLLDALGDEPIVATRFQAAAAEVRRQTGAKGKDLFHPIRVGLTGHASGPELVRLLPLIDEGSRLPLPHPVRSCRDRARDLLASPRGVRIP